MGYMIVLGNCYACGIPFHFNPNYVPSIPAQLTRTGVREPVCRGCVDRANPKRIENGLPPIEVHPQAYEPEEHP